MNDSDLPLAKFLRLQNGDDIISEVVEMGEDDNVHYLLINPLKVVYVESKSPGYLQVAFMPWVFPRICEHQEFTIYAEDVLMLSNVSENMNEHYWDNIELLQTYKETGKISKDEPEMDYQEELESLKEFLEQMANKRTFH